MVAISVSVLDSGQKRYCNSCQNNGMPSDVMDTSKDKPELEIWPLIVKIYSKS